VAYRQTISHQKTVRWAISLCGHGGTGGTSAMTVVKMITEKTIVEETARTVYCSQNAVSPADVLATWVAVAEFVAFSLKANKVSALIYRPRVSGGLRVPRRTPPLLFPAERRMSMRGDGVRRGCGV
jgi:hypothetical protein